MKAICPACQAFVAAPGGPCPRCGLSPAQLEGAWQAAARKEAEGQRLVNTSTLLLAIAGLLIVGGVGAIIAIGTLGYVPLLAGIVTVFVSAVVGQIGRGYQGRV